MDTTSRPWLNPTMRSGFLALCSFIALLLPGMLRGQGALPPTITTQPVDTSVFVAATASLTVSVEGTPPFTYQWFKNGTAIPAATDATYSIPSAVPDAAGYHVVVTNAAGSVTSFPVLGTVTKRPQTITFTAPATAAAASSVSLNAASSSGLPVQLALVSGIGALSGNTTLTSSGGTVVVRATQPGTAFFAAAEPVERSITFVLGALSPFITSPPLDQTVNAGSSATFRAAAIGTPAPAYQWSKDGAPLAGATGAAFVLATTSLADSGLYTVTVSNFAGTVTAGANLTVRAPPVFTAQPASQTATAGEAVTFSVATTAVPVATYQWRKNGTPIAGATAASLALRGVTATDGARYDVVASNALGAATSSAAVLTVITPDYTGYYRGTFTSAASAPAGESNFVLFVRPNRTAALIGYPALPGPAFATTDLPIALNGSFTQRITAGAQTITLQGEITPDGAVSGTVAELGVTLRGARVAAIGPAAAVAGLYHFALPGSAAARGSLLVTPLGDATLIVVSGANLDAGSGALLPDGRLSITTRSQIPFELRLADSALAGTVRANGITAPVSGAIETLVGREHLTNLAVRSITQNAAPLITGFVIAGTTPKQVLIRAAGPTLAQAPFNVPGAIGDPTLQVFRGNLIVAQNDDWGTPPANAAAITAAAARTGAFAFRVGSADAALVSTLPPGPYTVLVGGGNGTVLAEIYEVLETNETPGARRLVNTSARGLVVPGNPLIAGFFITGSVPQRVLIRGIGATLGAPPFNVAGALPNPQLTLFRGTTALKTNDDWFRDADAALIRDAATRAGAFALGAQSGDAAMVLYLEPGAYTAQVSGPTGANQNNSTGIALVEVYEAAP